MDLGGTKVSTGQTGRRDYYITPIGGFLRTDAILDWRAEGTSREQPLKTGRSTGDPQLAKLGGTVGCW